MNLFQRAAKGLNLTPTERALLKFVQSLLLTGIIAGLFAVQPLLAGSGSVDGSKLLSTFLLALLFSIVLAIAKYFQAHGDPALGTAIEATVGQVQRRVEMSDGNKGPEPIMLPLPKATGAPLQGIQTAATPPTNAWMLDQALVAAQGPQIPFPPIGTPTSRLPIIPPNQ